MEPLGLLAVTNPHTADFLLMIAIGGKSRPKVPNPWQKSIEIIDHKE
jgi:hypothetical protein